LPFYNFRCGHVSIVSVHWQRFKEWLDTQTVIDYDPPMSDSL
jgi:hypothetical protein